MSILLFATAIFLQTATAQRFGTCTECPLPGGKRGLDTTMVLHLRSGALLANCCSMSRTITESYDGPRQAVRFAFCDRSGGCTDTTIAIADIAYVRRGGLGGSEAPLRITVRPVREFQRVVRANVPLNFFEVTGFAGYGGADESARSIGFDDLYYGAEAMVAPFGALFGSRFAIAFGGAWLTEADRSRFPLFGHLRWTFLGHSRMVTRHRYFPDKCTFDYATPFAAPAPAEEGYTERFLPPPLDSSATLTHERDVDSPAFRPFLFAEGGIVLNGSFEGSTGRDPVNPEDEGQYFFGAGVGTPLFDILTVSVSYRFLRLNLYTPCAACETRSVVNTNEIHSVVLKFGLHLEW